MHMTSSQHSTDVTLIESFAHAVEKLLSLSSIGEGFYLLVRPFSV
jgi:hypothetical protein